jgi:hypothetical protein
VADTLQKESHMIEGSHYQNAYVTRDVARAVDRFTAQAEVRDVIQFEAPNEVITRDGLRTQVNRFAFLWVGGLQYEFIQPVSDAANVFTPVLPDDDSLRFHHSCMRVQDWDTFRARVDKQPFPVVIEGHYDGTKFLYLDTRELLGHYMEYAWMTDENWARMGGR